MLICIDAAYREDIGVACGIVFDNLSSSTPLGCHALSIEGLPGYVPGSFYLREMPLAVKVLQGLDEELEMVFIDAYVWLPGRRAGFGAHLYNALNGRTPVIGMAKKRFNAHHSCVRVLRGGSNRPLYVTAAGISEVMAAKIVREMAGRYRVPDMMRLADQQARRLLAKEKTVYG